MRSLDQTPSTTESLGFVARGLGYSIGITAFIGALFAGATLVFG